MSFIEITVRVTKRLDGSHRVELLTEAEVNALFLAEQLDLTLKQLRGAITKKTKDMGFVKPEDARLYLLNLKLGDL